MSFEMKRSQIRGPKLDQLASVGFGLICLFCISNASAEEVTKLSSSTFGGTLWFSFVSLMLGAGLILLVAWLVRKNTASKLPTSNAQILFQYPLGPRDRVIVMRILNRVIVLGQSATQINYLTELEPEEVADINMDVPNHNIKNTFAKYIKANFN
jgi:flagellar protein FliO/FliZ